MVLTHDATDYTTLLVAENVLNLFVVLTNNAGLTILVRGYVWTHVLTTPAGEREPNHGSDMKNLPWLSQIDYYENKRHLTTETGGNLSGIIPA